MNFEDAELLAGSLPDAMPPLAVDIDGTLTDASSAVDPRAFPVLRAWPSTLVIATGKAMPYPVALCHFLGIPPHLIAENGGVVLEGETETISFQGDRQAAQAVAEAYESRGYSLGWGQADLVNRWRETELAVSRDSPLEPLEEIANEHGLDVVDTGYAYHVKSPGLTKGAGLEVFAEFRGLEPESFAFIGDSANDVPGFEAAGHSIAVSNAAESAKDTADCVTEQTYGDGFLEAVEMLGELTTD